MKGSALVGLAFCSNKTFVVFHNLAANSQAYARAWKFVLVVQALKYLEDLFSKPGIEAQAIVRYRNADVFFGFIGPRIPYFSSLYSLCGHLYQGLVAWLVVSNGIGKQVAKQDIELVFVAGNSG